MTTICSTYEPPMRAEATLRALRQVCRELGEAGVRKTTDLTPEIIGRWIRLNPGRSPARVASLLRTLAPAARYAARVGYLRCNPFEYRKPSQWVRLDAMPPRIVPGRRHRTAEELGRVLDLADAEAAAGSWEAGRLQCLVYVLAYTGMRHGEAVHLSTADCDLEARVVTIAPKADWRPKTLKSSARLPMAPELAEVLARWIPRAGCEWLLPGRRLRGPWTGGPPGRRPLDEVRALGHRAGVEGLSLLAFRKSLGTLAKAQGITQLGLKALLRHTNVETQRFYDLEDPEILRGEVAKIHYPRRIG